MGDLEPWMDEPFLRQLWTSIGEAVIVKLIRDKRTNSSLGYAFIGFPSPVAAQRALATVHGTKMPKSQRNFRLNWAAGGGILDKKEERAPEYSLFVGDLSNDVDETYLLAMFRQRYASCHSAKVMTDPISGLSRGYGFVRFHDPQEQLMALTEMNGVVCGQRHIRISLATPKTNANAAAHLATSPAMSPPDSVYHPSTTMPSFHSPMPYLSPHLSPTLSSSPPSALLPPPSDSANQVARYFQLALQAPALVQQPTDPSNTTVFIGGLSTPISEEELLQYFNPFGEITYVKIPPGKGCGFVQYISRASAETAIERMNGFQIGQSRIRLSWGRSQHDKMPTSTNSLSNTLLMSAPSASTSSSSTSTNNDHPLLGNPPHPSSFHPYAYASTHPPPVPNPAFSLSPLSSSSSSTSSYLPYYHTPLSPTLASPLESSSHSQPFSLLR
ncbi:RNA-binding domain-containing protein [Hesseltinella vesiculosa]|uniref:RNA-binding domain-containing protein n=1 Tax=Hesseltinella vesiculosa TaxID=101127 RepID=A0A1X2GT12_9FUNG|nr:RNA-binding domain-containing protein [Hesseltinella vesiculosa]